MMCHVRVTSPGLGVYVRTDQPSFSRDVFATVVVRPPGGPGSRPLGRHSHNDG
jgi:hypothetical protein